MRVRSVLAALAVSGLGLGVLVRCNLPELPPGPQAVPTHIGFVRGAFLSVPTTPFDHASLIASMKELNFITVVIDSVADKDGEHVSDRVALAIELQAALDADVFIGTYKPDPNLDPNNFTSCYPGGLALTSGTTTDKLIACSKAASDQVAAALRAANAPSRIGCYITPRLALEQGLDETAVPAFANFLGGSAPACVTDQRFVGVSMLVELGTTDPNAAGVVVREAIADSGVGVVMLDDGVGRPDASPYRAANSYQGFRNALEDREPSVVVWANLEAYACTDGTCLTQHPAPPDRYRQQLCSARQRVDGIMTTEYFSDLAGTALIDASADDLDASAQLRAEYQKYVDSGATLCP